MASLEEAFSHRYTATRSMLRMLEPNPNLPDDLRFISVQIADVTRELVEIIPDGPELTVGLRKLLEAKDCLVRAKLFPDRV